MSELLRRAARRHERDADRLQGDAWLQFLDAGSKQPLFVVPEHGRLLLEGGFRREIDNEAVDALQPQMRARFLALMQRPHKRPTSVRRLVGSKASSP